MPDGLTEIEQAAWLEIVALLEPRGGLTPCDAPIVELTAKTIVTMRHADAVITREGSTVRTASGYLQQRPEVVIQHKARLLFKQLLGELDMSPASRSNVNVPPPAVEGSSFQKFLERDRRIHERRQQRPDTPPACDTDPRLVGARARHVLRRSANTMPSMPSSRRPSATSSKR